MILLPICTSCEFLLPRLICAKHNLPVFQVESPEPAFQLCPVQYGTVPSCSVKVLNEARLLRKDPNNANRASSSSFAVFAFELLVIIHQFHNALDGISPHYVL